MASTTTLRIFTLQPSSGVPIYLQLMQQVRRMVASGQLTPGTELPSVREVATEYTVNPTTISKAHDDLGRTARVRILESAAEADRVAGGCAGAGGAPAGAQSGRPVSIHRQEDGEES
jgi:DNA-binding transcriptional MocR family regulator